MRSDESDTESTCTTPYVGSDEDSAVNPAESLVKKDSAEVIINMIFCNPNDFEIKTRPIYIRKNFVCTVNSANISIEECKADGNGVYTYVGKPKKYYYVSMKDNQVEKCLMVKKDDEDKFCYKTRISNTYTNVFVETSSVYELTRLYRKSKKMVGTLKDSSGITIPYYFLSYKWLDGKEHNSKDFIVASHGNAKHPHCSEFNRAERSLINSTVEKLKSGKSPDVTYHEVIAEQVYLVQLTIFFLLWFFFLVNSKILL